MKCPFCSSENTRVIDSRPADDNNSIRRRRLCDDCGKRFTTYEKVETIPLIVIKKDNIREQYDRAKIEGGVLRACHKRPISIDQIIGGDENSISLVEKIEDESQKEAFNSYENRMILDDAIKRLEPIEQQLVVLNYYEGLNQREISERLNISQMQVSRKLKKSLQKLFEIVSKKGLKQYE